jgi:hypothetical protein
MVNTKDPESLYQYRVSKIHNKTDTNDKERMTPEWGRHLEDDPVDAADAHKHDHKSMNDQKIRTETKQWSEQQFNKPAHDKESLDKIVECLLATKQIHALEKISDHQSLQKRIYIIVNHIAVVLVHQNKAHQFIQEPYPHQPDKRKKSRVDLTVPNPACHSGNRYGQTKDDVQPIVHS